MPTITLSVPEDLKAEMDKTKFINWSEVAREAIKNKVLQLALFNSIVKESKLTEEEANKFAIELGRKIKSGMHKKFKDNKAI
jgi:polyhydroxyalkanoate synthesis regulator phasin